MSDLAAQSDPPPFNRPAHQEQAEAIAAAVGEAIKSGGRTTVAVIGERVTRVETKIEGLEASTAVIRSTLHSVNAELQKASIHEANCAKSLAQIAEQTKGLPEALAKLSVFEEMKPRLAVIIEEATLRKGAWRMWMLIGGILTVVGSFSGAIVALVIALMHR